MNYHIVGRDSFRMIGKSTAISGEYKHGQLLQFWQDCHTDGTIEILHSFSENPIIGAGTCGDANGNFEYMIGIAHEDSCPNGFSSWHIPASTWAVFDPIISVPDLVGSVWAYIFNDFLVNSQYGHANTPDLEVNHRIDNPSARYACEIWIPVIDKSLGV